MEWKQQKTIRLKPKLLVDYLRADDSGMNSRTASDARRKCFVSCSTTQRAAKICQEFKTLWKLFATKKLESFFLLSVASIIPSVGGQNKQKAITKSIRKKRKLAAETEMHKLAARFSRGRENYLFTGAGECGESLSFHVHDFYPFHSCDIIKGLWPLSSICRLESDLYQN